MEKDIYKILNDIDINIDEYEKEDFNDIEKKKLKNNFRKSINKRKYNKGKSIVAAALVVGVVSIGFFGTGVGAEVLGKISESISTSIGIQKNLDNYNTVINKQITDNGITIQLNEVILDQVQKQLIISDTISSGKLLKEYESFDSDRSIYINNKKVRFTSGSGGSRNLDDYTTQTVYEYDLGYLDDIDLSGELDIKIAYSKVMINHENSQRGKWEFEFKANGDQLKIDTKEINLNNSFTLENGEKIILEKYTSNALGQNIICKVENFNKKESYNIMLKGTDDLGNEVIFDLIRGSKYSMVLRYDNIKRNLDDNAKELILTPYAVKFPENSGKLSNDFERVGEEFKININ